MEHTTKLLTKEKEKCYVGREKIHIGYVRAKRRQEVALQEGREILFVS